MSDQSINQSISTCVMEKNYKKINNNNREKILKKTCMKYEKLFKNNKETCNSLTPIQVEKYPP